MQIRCEQCNHCMTYQATIPKFCSECGAALNVSWSSTFDDPTIAQPVSAPKSDDFSAATIAPSKTRPAFDAPAPTLPTGNIGPYRLVRKLGQGGMGTVFEAVQTETGRQVALKLLAPAVRGTDEMVKRFQRESQIAASINHPRSTFVYESGQHDDQIYIVMELMTGGTLKDVVDQEGPLPVGRAVDFLLDMIDGLLVAHNAGIVHRDIKPSNSFVDRDGRIKVGDFGLAKSFLGDSSLTQTGTFMGTPQFAAPEQIRNADVDERTDIYALGGTLFYLLTGRAPFVGNPAQVISSIASDIPPLVSEFARNVPRSLVQLIAQMLAKVPDERPFNLSMLRDRLLPFSTRGAVAADPGRRMAAFFLDSMIVAFGSGLLVAVISSPLLILMSALGIAWHPQTLGIAIMFPIVLLYYSYSESTWGRTVGKWAFGIRVVDAQSQSPAFLTALLRALMIPGITLVCSQLVTVWLVDPGDLNNMQQVLTMTFQSQASGFLCWIPTLLLLTSARRDNGYRVMHDLATGTSVVRLAGDLESKLLDHLPVTVPAQVDNQPKLGNFQILGYFHHAADGLKTCLGRDEGLDRSVWLFDGFEQSPISKTRRHLTRSSRLRVIRQSSHSRVAWYATESVPGCTFMEAIHDARCQWNSFCPLMRDVAVELAASQEQDMIPANFTVDHLWLDHTGQIRVLDHRLVYRFPSAEKPPAEPISDTGQVVDAIQTLLGRFMQFNTYPVRLMEIRDELQRRRDDSDVFEDLANRFNDCLERVSSWNIIDRVGMLAISLCLEFSLLLTTIFMTGLVMMLTSTAALAQALVPAAMGMLVAAGYGFFFGGGPAMHLSGVSLRRHRDRRPASRGQAVWRSLVAWFPWVVLVSMFLYLAFDKLGTDPDVVQVNTQNSLLLVQLIPWILAMFAIVGVGLLIAIINPRRGIPDWLAGTMVMRR